MAKKKSEYRDRTPLENLKRYKIKYTRLIKRYSELITKLQKRINEWDKDINRIGEEIERIKREGKEEND